jgi:hypothetical protein
MNRYARIMQGVGWLAVAVWVAALVQGRRVEADGPDLALHTVLALAAAATTLLPRVWTVVFLLLGGWRFADAGARRARNVALAASALALAILAFHFALSGAMLWRRITPSQHAAFGAAVLLSHLAALWCERRALLARERGDAGSFAAPVSAP